MAAAAVASIGYKDDDISSDKWCEATSTEIDFPCYMQPSILYDHETRRMSIRHQKTSISRQRNDIRRTEDTR